MSATAATANNTLVETTISNATQVVNFALNSGKLLANGSENNGRVLMSKVPVNNGVINTTFSLPIILVLIFILASIVGVIVTALFVMRNRFSTWRLDRSKSAPVDGEDGIKAESTTPPTTEVAEVTTAEKEKSSADSDAPLIAEEVAAPAPETTTAPVETTTAVMVVEETEVAVVGKEVVTSSSSLIVNVLNELSESVACKLESMDPEKEPLKSETAKTDTE